MKCAVCPREISDNQWAKTDAFNEGWFEKRDGTAWCPEHVPTWVSAWRVRKAKR